MKVYMHVYFYHDGSHKKYCNHKIRDLPLSEIKLQVGSGDAYLISAVKKSFFILQII